MAKRPRLRHPAQFVVFAFALGVAGGTALLALPVARGGDASASFLVSLSTATSSVCVTGLVVVDTPSYWSTFGEVVILVLIQVGGFGFMTLTSLLALLVFRRLGLRTRLSAQAETKTLGLGDVRRVVRGVAVTSLASPTRMPASKPRSPRSSAAAAAVQPCTSSATAWGKRAKTSTGCSAP